jgi:hypothetical protein
VQFGPSRIEFNLTNHATVLWVEACLLEPGSLGPPMAPAGEASAVLFFSASRGILALDGDGQGNGVFATVTNWFPADRFVRLSVRLDFAAQRYEVWIDGARRRTELRFKNDTRRAFSGAQHCSPGVGYLDDFSLSTWGLDKDTDGDGLADLDEAKFDGSDPLRRDTDADGADDRQELLAGTNPSDARSVFAVRLSRDESGRPCLRVPTAPGREYLLQRRWSLGPGTWQPVPGAAIPGDGSEHVFVETDLQPACFYRALILK